MSQKYHFRAAIENAGSGGAYVSVPFDVEKAFGKKRVKIRATIEGEPYRGTLVRMGGLNHMLIVLKEIRENIGKSFGDEVSVELEEDLELRQIEIPADLMQALETDSAARDIFNRLAYTHQREYVRWINEAKREQTRQSRLQQTLALLKKGKSGH
jgi:hypothetical protein